MKYIREYKLFESLKDDRLYVETMISDVDDYGYSYKVISYRRNETSDSELDVIQIRIWTENPERDWSSGGHYIDLETIKSKIGQVASVMDEYYYDIADIVISASLPVNMVYKGRNYRYNNLSELSEVSKNWSKSDHKITKVEFSLERFSSL